MKKILLFLLLSSSYLYAGTSVSSVVPPYPNDATKFLNGAARWTVPAGNTNITGQPPSATLSNITAKVSVDSDGNITAPSITVSGALSIASAILPFKDALIMSDSSSNFVAATEAAVTNAAGVNLKPALTEKLDATKAAVTNAIGYEPAPSIGTTNFTVATLPAGAYPGAQVWCSDALTPWGTGDRVEWDGSAWRTVRTKVLATTDVTTYVLSCVTNATKANTARSEIDLASKFGAYGYTLNRSAGQGGSGALGGTVQSVRANGTMAGYYNGTAANSYARCYGTPDDQQAAGDVYACGGAYSVATAPNGTDNYIVWIGLNNVTATNIPWANGIAFVYDRYNLLARTSPGAETNNWLCYSVKSGATNYTDSGLPVTVSSTTCPDRLAIVATSTGATFLTNGVVCSTHNSTCIPAGTLYLNSVLNYKTLGSTGIYLNEMNCWYHIRRADGSVY